MGNWLTTLMERKTGLAAGFVGDDEAHEDFAERMRVTDVPPPPGAGAAAAPTPAGWHPDPFQRHELRFHDGVDWTENVADNGTASTDPTGTAPAPAAGTDTPPRDEQGGR